MTPFGGLFKIAMEEVEEHNGYICGFMIKAMVVERGVNHAENAVVRDFITSQGYMKRNRYAFTKKMNTRVPPATDLSKMCWCFPQLETPYKFFIREPEATVPEAMARFPKYTESKLQRIKTAAHEYHAMEWLLADHGSTKRTGALRREIPVEQYVMLYSVLKDLDKTKSPFSREEIVSLMNLPVSFVSMILDNMLQAGRLRVVTPKSEDNDPEILAFA